VRILQIHNQYVDAGGEDTIADTEAGLLRDAGHDVECFRVRNAGRGRAGAMSFAAAPWNFSKHQAVRERVRRMHPDVAHVHNTWFTLSPSIFHALHAEGIPTVMTFQNFRLICAEAKLFRDGGLCTECVGTHPWRAVRYACYRGSRPASTVAALTIALNRRVGTWDGIERFFAPSQFVKDTFVRAGFDPHRIVVKPNVIGDPGPRSRPPSCSSSVVFVGRIAAEKGPRLLLDAWREAEQLAPDLQLVMIGDGPLRAELEREPPPRTHFLGWVEPAQIAEHLLSARALVFPTQWSENFGRSIIEAMASGLPVLASDIATPAELVGELGSEWLVEPHSLTAWRGALAGLADDSAVDAAGARARTLYEQKYNLDVGLQSLLDTYEHVRSERDLTATCAA
jgi:glycosyltransferase involved in cell wall biosynthesis